MESSPSLFNLRAMVWAVSLIDHNGYRGTFRQHNIQPYRNIIAVKMRESGGMGAFIFLHLKLIIQMFSMSLLTTSR
jgi:hypothetical protein